MPKGGKATLLLQPLPSPSSNQDEALGSLVAQPETMERVRGQVFRGEKSNSVNWLKQSRVFLGPQKGGPGRTKGEPIDVVLLWRR